MTATATSGRVRIDEVGAALLVSVNGVHGGCSAVAAELPEERDRISVVMADADIAYSPQLAQGLRQWVPMRHESVRLVAPRER